jgi:hypothetical protein
MKLGRHHILSSTLVNIILFRVLVRIGLCPQEYPSKQASNVKSEAAFALKLRSQLRSFIKNYNHATALGTLSKASLFPPKQHTAYLGYADSVGSATSLISF